ncbi:MAG: SMC-Scp complex subunit ScpB [Nitrospinae bacterium]|nr:SMC-Scp complex subunit ScpB [Nitrospinota bacterium]
MERDKIKAIIENLLLVSGQPISLNKIQEIIGTECGKDDTKAAMKELVEDYSNRGLQIQEVAEGFQLCTRVDYSDWIKKFYKLDKGSKLSPAALDTLSIIAYKQPITRAEIEDIRGVDSGGVVKTLFEKKLLRTMGRKQVAGRPIMYGTSKTFLEYFGLRDISELPTLKEFMEEKEEGEQEPLQTSLPLEERTEAAVEHDDGTTEEELNNTEEEHGGQ